MTAPGPSGFDDPNDKGQKRIKGAADDFARLVHDEIFPLNQKFAAAVRALYEHNEKILTELKAFMLHGFIAVTDLHPSKCTLVQRTEGGAMSYTFMESDLFERQHKRIADLEKALDDLRAENRDLRRR